VLYPGAEEEMTVNVGDKILTFNWPLVHRPDVFVADGELFKSVPSLAFHVF
jgi:hypothetical protein